jgi:phasin family protein
MPAASTRRTSTSTASSTDAINIAERTLTHMINNMDDMTNWTKQFYDSYTMLATTYTKGCEEIYKTATTCTQNMAQQYMQCCKNMLGAKTMKEAMDTQSEYVRTQFDTVMSETTKMSEICVKLATEASEPMQAQFSNVVNKMSKAA